ncbi:lipopolysaccharide transport periplasmic protein LptA [Polycladidibacter hongkongensis]|uniref:lipopolysaccharide transport periplasmic protein LptA n=1 Tax=Polycladidibacter hongkongensis TaxID=1647556 RepID=UPI00082F3F55|nr:lipopolysaccharide transport periplasmic protein LptA [Pseudovibrio hongkongensis]
MIGLKKFSAATSLLALLVFCGAAAAQETFSDAFAGFGSNSNEPIEIEAKDLEVRDKEKSAIFSGNVVVVQGTSKLKSNRLVVYYSGSLEGGEGPQQSISRLEASGDVLISADDQIATGDNASFDMEKEFMVMTGKKVVLSQGDNVIVGKKITVNLKSGKVNMDASKSGRVKLLLQPNSMKKN